MYGEPREGGKKETWVGGGSDAQLESKLVENHFNRTHGSPESGSNLQGSVPFLFLGTAQPTVPIRNRNHLNRKKLKNRMEPATRTENRNIWDAEMSSAMQKLESRLIQMTNFRSYFTSLTSDDRVDRTMSELGEVKEEVNWILDFLKRKKLEEGSSLHYLVYEVVEMVHHALNQDSNKSILDLHEKKELMLRLTNEEVEKGDYPMRCGKGGREEDLVGIKQLVEHLLSEQILIERSGLNPSLITERGLRILWIKGMRMRGVGKTTLAREMYNHPDVLSHFDCRAWLHLSQQLSRKEALIKLIRQLLQVDDVSSMEKMDNNALQNMLRQHLKDRRYFIVLDDVSDNIYLGPVVYALLEKGVGSRLLLTIRQQNSQVRIPFFYLGHIHKMKFLNGDESWNLLGRTVCNGTGDEKVPKKLEKKAKQMLTKCNGLPLAIKELGIHWVKRRMSGLEWDEVLDSMDVSVTLTVLESTYNAWDSLTKSSFLYLGFFKEGTAIMTRKLVQIWMSGKENEDEEEEEDVEEKEYDYQDEENEEFNEIVYFMGIEYKENKYQTSGYKKLLSVFSKEYIIESKDDNIACSGAKTCRINTLFHMLSMKKLKEEPRHHVIYCSREKQLNHCTSEEDKDPVTLFFHGGGYFDADWENLKQLQILDFEGFGLKNLPKEVGALIKLKYLGLKNNHIKELPTSLGHLKNLEVLDLELNFMVEVLDIIRKMDKLRHLYMSNIICQKPLKIDALRKLKTLTYISIDNWKYEASGLEMMISLHKLGIEDLDGDSSIHVLFTSLSKLKNLKHLILRGFRFRTMPCLDNLHSLHNLFRLKLDGRLTTLPSVDSFPPNIVYLTLVNCSLDSDPMLVLEKLHTLRYLKLRNAYNGLVMVVSDQGFPKLITLCIEELWNLRKVRVGKQAMMKIQRLEINGCPYLKTLPKEIRSMSNLEELKIVATKSNATKIRKLRLFHKIKHVDIQP